MDFRNPKFGNTYISDSQVSIISTLDNQKEPIYDSNWPTIRQFKIALEALSIVERDNLQSFFMNSAGTEIEIIDHENVTWSGFILDPNPKLRQTRPGCGYETEFTFEGSVVT